MTEVLHHAMKIDFRLAHFDGRRIDDTAARKVLSDPSAPATCNVPDILKCEQTADCAIRIYEPRKASFIPLPAVRTSRPLLRRLLEPRSA